MVAPAVVLGTDSQGKAVTWDFSSHAGLQGQTRSGKSSLSYAILTQAFAQPNVQIAGVDVSGILLAPIAAARPDWRPTLHTGGLDLSRAAGVLGAVVHEMDRRVAALVRARRDKLTEFTPEQPLLLVVFEELPGFIQALVDDDAAEARKPRDRLAPKVQRSLRRILAEGAKVGIVALVIAQRMSVEALPGDARSNLGTRITLRMSDEEGIKMLHGGVDDEEGQFLATAPPGVGLIDQVGKERGHIRCHALGYQRYLFDLAAPV